MQDVAAAVVADVALAPTLDEAMRLAVRETITFTPRNLPRSPAKRRT